MQDCGHNIEESNSEHRTLKLPSLIVFGAIKSGTGALHQYLNHHPDIFMSVLKEPRYFMRRDAAPIVQRNKSAALAINTLQEYSALFESATHESIIGESSSGYIDSEFAAKRIKEAIPNVRLVASLRNPVDRACAHFQMLTKTGKIDASILENKTASWAQSSYYFEKLKTYFELFPRERIKIIVYEEWVNDTRSALKNLYQFLGVDDTYELNSQIVYRPATVLWPKVRRGSRLRQLKRFIPARILALLNNYKARNVRPVEELIPTDVRQVMNEWYSQDIERLEELLGRDLSVWRR